MITSPLGIVCDEFINVYFRVEDFRTLSAAEILDSFSFALPLYGKVFLLWTDPPDILLAMKNLWDADIANGFSDGTSHVAGSIRSPPDIYVDTAAPRSRESASRAFFPSLRDCRSLRYTVYEAMPISLVA